MVIAKRSESCSAPRSGRGLRITRKGSVGHEPPRHGRHGAWKRMRSSAADWCRAWTASTASTASRRSAASRRRGRTPRSARPRSILVDAAIDGAGDFVSSVLDFTDTRVVALAVEGPDRARWRSLVDAGAVAALAREDLTAERLGLSLRAVAAGATTMLATYRTALPGAIATAAGAGAHVARAARPGARRRRAADARDRRGAALLRAHRQEGARRRRRQARRAQPLAGDRARGAPGHDLAARRPPGTGAASLLGATRHSSVSTVSSPTRIVNRRTRPSNPGAVTLNSIFVPGGSRRLLNRVVSDTWPRLRSPGRLLERQRPLRFGGFLHVTSHASGRCEARDDEAPEQDARARGFGGQR